MKATQIKLGIMAVLMLIVGTLVTCETTKSKPDTPEVLQDTIFLSQWRREKAEKLHVIAYYENRLSTLQHKHDSLAAVVAEKKAQLSADHSKSKMLEAELAARITRADSGLVRADSLRPLVDSLNAACELDNTNCNETVAALEQELAERDSSLAFHQHIEAKLKEVQKELEVNNQVITGQLSIATKEQQRAARQKKMLAGGLLLLTGITSSLILIRTLK